MDLQSKRSTKKKQTRSKTSPIMHVHFKIVLCVYLSLLPLVLGARDRAEGHGGVGGTGGTDRSDTYALSLTLGKDSLARDVPQGTVSNVNAACNLFSEVEIENGNRYGIGCSASGYIVGTTTGQIYLSVVITKMIYNDSDLGPCVVDGFIDPGNYNTGGQSVGVICLGPIPEGSGTGTLQLDPGFQILNLLLINAI
jgi:hypothetical protein